MSSLAIPQFNEFNILPEGIHECTFADIENRFLYNSHRVKIWKEFLDYFERIKVFDEILSLYFDGSFIGDKSKPSDLDIVVEFRSIAMWGRMRRAHPHLFDGSVVRQVYGIDCLPCAPDIMHWQLDHRLTFQEIKAKEIARRGLPIGSKKGIVVVRLRGDA